MKNIVYTIIFLLYSFTTYSQRNQNSAQGLNFNANIIVGLNSYGYNNLIQENSTTDNLTGIGSVLNLEVNYNKPKYFWNNYLFLNFGWAKDTEAKQKSSYTNVSDVLNFRSLLGYKLNSSFSISALSEYRTTLLNDINNPGYLDTGAGITWKKVSELSVSVHPLNYNYIFTKTPRKYNNSFGSKVLVELKKDYTYLKFRSRFSAFFSYKNIAYSNWMWRNTLTANLYKGIGIGLDCGIRQNKQEAFNKLGAFKTFSKTEKSNNPLQVYCLLGLNYSI